MPDGAKTDAVVEMELHLRDMLRQVDSNLLEKWKRMLDPDYRPPGAGFELRTPRPEEAPDVTRDTKAFTAAIRTRVFALLRAWSAILILLGNGVVANVALKRTKGEGSGFIVIALGWGMAVFVAVAVVARASGAHINPAVSLALATAGSFPWAQVPLYWTAQMLGAMLGGLLIFLVYRRHFESTADLDTKLAVFCTAPAIPGVLDNFFSELVGTFVLSLAVLEMAHPDVGLGALDALPVGLLVLAIGLSLGGTTGYAINPARDLGPRLVHALLPARLLGGKRDSDFGYALVPLVAPLAGAFLAAGLHSLLR